MDKTTFERAYLNFRAQAATTSQRFEFSPSDNFPCLSDDTLQTNFDHHYVYHTGWAARRLLEIRPEVHVDFGSSLYFISIASALCPIEFYDYRPAFLSLDRVESGTANLLDLPFAEESLSSVSCMHVVEHVGLGRYGDPLDYDGDLKAMAELARVVGRGGSLLFVVPVGRPRLLFNAHRIYSFAQIAEVFIPSFSVQKFSLVTDGGEFITDAHQWQADGQWYGCGCFHFKKHL